ncbi:hypothetical protein FE257_001791 [Aspergillus nanangensis]|uniref:Serine peptidase, family S28 n=1 Tax=Aspergillus nanangensis TaxID=2582783 RepID=A0AAD4CDF3_ASPNN|nr:hypothetical protein FE257_001791 [Aspergillus nanangensis]
MGPTAGMNIGMRESRYAQDLRLSAQRGVDPNLILNGTTSFHDSISHLPKEDPTVTPEYVTVRLPDVPCVYRNDKLTVIQIPIDHGDPTVGTYQNRYWVYDKFYTPGSPIMVFDSGEANGSVYTFHLTSEKSFFRKMLQEFKAMGIVWEHRYYGGSLPYPINSNTTPEQFKYLTTRQAIDDIPYFAKNFTHAAQPDVDLTPEGTPWVVVGGSYAGNRAAVLRNQYPDTVYAAFSSSAPVQAQVDMGVYFEQVYRGMVTYGLGNCTKDVQAAWQYIDSNLANNDTAVTIKQLFFGDGAEVNNNEAFTAALGRVFDTFQSNGIAAGIKGGVQDFCNWLEVDPMTNKTAGAEGVAAAHGGKYVAERWASWDMTTPLVNYNLATNCKGLDQKRPRTCQLESFPTDSDSLSWTWQYCTEYGYFQSNNFGPHALVSSYQTLAYQQKICNMQFSEAVKKGILPAQPRADATNNEFGGWSIRPSNTYFSVGEFDPWTTLTVLSQEPMAPQDRAWTKSIPQCEKSNGGVIFGQIIGEAEHCFDFQAFAGQESRDLFQQALKEWLKCFGQKK